MVGKRAPLLHAELQMFVCEFVKTRHLTMCFRSFKARKGLRLLISVQMLSLFVSTALNVCIYEPFKNANHVSNLETRIDSGIWIPFHRIDTSTCYVDVSYGLLNFPDELIQVGARFEPDLHHILPHSGKNTRPNWWTMKIGCVVCSSLVQFTIYT